MSEPMPYHLRCLADAVERIYTSRHPEYTWVCERRQIDADNGQDPVPLGDGQIKAAADDHDARAVSNRDELAAARRSDEDRVDEAA